MSYYKGLNLELVIADLFRKNGYTVIHNLKKKGKSGVEHQIDVYAEYKAPLHTSAIIIEAKNYESSIDKDKIMKFVQIVDDLNVDRGIFVTTSDYVASAETTAGQYNNIELWNREKLTKLVGELQLTTPNNDHDEESEIKAEKNTLAPKISKEIIRKNALLQIEKKAKGGLFGAGKIIENLQDIRLFYYPYYDFSIQAKVIHEEKTGFRSKEFVEKIISCKVSIDAKTCGIVEVDEIGISYNYALPQITEEEAKFLRTFRNGFEMKDVLGLGASEAKSKRMVNGLVTRNVLDATSSRPIFYMLKKSYPDDPSILGSLLTLYTSSASYDNDAITIEPEVEPSTAIKIIEAYLDVKVKDIHLVYYPFYQVQYGREDRSIRIENLDGMYGSVVIEPSF